MFIWVTIIASHFALHSEAHDCKAIQGEKGLFEDETNLKMDVDFFHRLKRSCSRASCEEESIDYEMLLRECLVLGDFELRRSRDNSMFNLLSKVAGGSTTKHPNPILLLMLLNPDEPRSISDATQAIRALNYSQQLTVIINLSREDISANHISALISNIVQSGTEYIQQQRLFITTKSVFLEYSFGLKFGTSDLMVLLMGMASYFPQVDFCLIYDQEHPVAMPFVSKAVDDATSVSRSMEVSLSKFSNWCVIEIVKQLGLMALKFPRFVSTFMPTYWRLPFEFRSNHSITDNMKALGTLNCAIPKDPSGKKFQL